MWWLTVVPGSMNRSDRGITVHLFRILVVLQSLLSIICIRLHNAAYIRLLILTRFKLYICSLWILLGGRVKHLHMFTFCLKPILRIWKIALILDWLCNEVFKLLISEEFSLLYIWWLFANHNDWYNQPIFSVLQILIHKTRPV